MTNPDRKEITFKDELSAAANMMRVFHERVIKQVRVDLIAHTNDRPYVRKAIEFSTFIPLTSQENDEPR